MKEINKKEKNKKFAVVTLATALIALFTFVTIGIKSESYAIDTKTSQAEVKLEDFPKEVFTDDLIEQGEKIRYYGLKDTVVENDEITTKGTILTNTRVFPFYAREASNEEEAKTKEKFQVFCSEKDVRFGENVVYTKGESIEDSTLLYLIKLINEKLFDPNYEEEYLEGELNYNNIPENIKTWITQMSIWKYLSYQEDDKYNKEFKTLVEEEMNQVTALCQTDENTNDINKCKNIEYITDEEGNLVYLKEYVEDLLEQASDLSEISNYKNLSIEIDNKKQKTINLSKDGKFYESPSFSIEAGPDEIFKEIASYQLVSDDSSAIIVDEDQKEVTSLTPDTNYYIRIPKDKVKANNKNVKLTINASYEGIEGNYYDHKDIISYPTSEDSRGQRILNIKKVPTTLTKTLTMSINYEVEVPNTSSNNTKTIYIIGLIVLVSGIAVISANIKKNKVN